MPKILVIGATGLLGRPVTTRLIKKKYDVRVFTTYLERAQVIYADDTEYASGDVRELDTLKLAMHDREFVYISLKGGPTADDYLEIIGQGTRNIVAAAKECGIRKIVAITGANVRKENISDPAIEAKLAAEKAIKESGIKYTIMRPSWFCESIPLFRKQNKMIYIGKGKAQFHFLAGSEYARYVDQCFYDEVTDNKTFTLFGPEALSIPDAMRIYLAVCFPNITIDRLPLWLAKFSAMLTTNKRLKSMVRMMDFFEKHDDSDVEIPPDEADRVFGRSKLTIKEWSKKYYEIIKG